MILSRKCLMQVVLPGCWLLLSLPAFGQNAAPAPTPQETGKLVRDLKSPDPVLRFNAALTLAKMGSAAVSAVPALIETLSDADGQVRAYAAFVLGKIGGGALPAVPALADTLKDPSGSVRLSAAEALGRVAADCEKGLDTLDAPARTKAQHDWQAAQTLLDKMHAKETPDPAAFAKARLAVRHYVTALQKANAAR